MRFEWDEKKNRSNMMKHGISFKEASEVFDDPLHVSILDERFDDNDERWITIGATLKRTIIVVGHLYSIVDNGEERIRIITARKALKNERDRYETL
ncbi:MAG: BrnT family toxin [Deltaproteobacteria bacterium]|nr:BrnT family toxin [Deltaproteobacteria bacterium]